MAHVYCFSRNRATGVEQIDEKTLRASCRLQDTLMDASLEIIVKVPELEITDVHCEVRRGPVQIDETGLARLQRVKGVRVGPGMTKIIKGLVGDGAELKEPSFMIEECCHAVILSFTKDVLDSAPKDPEEGREHYARMLKKNPRLYNSCIAFAPGSSLVKG